MAIQCLAFLITAVYLFYIHKANSALKV